ERVADVHEREEPGLVGRRDPLLGVEIELPPLGILGVHLLLEAVHRVLEHRDHQAMLAIDERLLAKRPEELRRQHRVGREWPVVLLIHRDRVSHYRVTSIDRRVSLDERTRRLFAPLTRRSPPFPSAALRAAPARRRAWCWQTGP